MLAFFDSIAVWVIRESICRGDFALSPLQCYFILRWAYPNLNARRSDRKALPSAASSVIAPTNAGIV